MNKETYFQRISLIVFLLSTYVFTKAQDSIIVYQNKSAMFSNRYIFYFNGTFRHYYRTDDGQIWYGNGKYKDKKKRRILRFGDPDLISETDPKRIHYESNFERVLRISGRKFVSKDYYFTTRKRKVTFEER